MIEMGGFTTVLAHDLPGGLVNRTSLVTGNNSESYVQQQSQNIDQDFMEIIYADRGRCEDAGVRQIQVDPAKFVRAKKVSAVLLAEDFRHAPLLAAEDCRTFGTAILHFVDGLPGSDLLERDKERVWSAVGNFVAITHAVPHESVASSWGQDLAMLEKPDWLADRFLFLVSRLQDYCPASSISTSAAMQAYQRLVSLLPPVERPICLTYDDPKPDSLIFPADMNEEPFVVDLESFTVGHRIIDGIGRGLYWGPIREPLKKGLKPDHAAQKAVAAAYNKTVQESWRVPSDTIDLWCIASEMFWLPDVAATHTIAPFLPAARLQGTHNKLQRFSALVDALGAGNTKRATEITFS